MRYSQLFGKTVKTVPRDITAVSHKLLYKGGFIRQSSAGRYFFLPLGMRVWEKIQEILKEEMEKISVQRVLSPTLHPLEIWKATARDKAFGELMLVVEDHQGATFAIGATAEGMMVELVKKFRPSYKDLPIVIYQFSQKFRDEKRPRGGLLRTREFMMKDAYSFAATEKDSFKIYQEFYNAYLRIAKRLDLEVIPVEAVSGAIGGEYSHEFMVPSPAGEDTIFVCDTCDYAANVERAEFEREDINSSEEMLPLEDVYQPAKIDTIQEMSDFFRVPKCKILKDVLYKTSEGDYYVAIIRGDLNVSESKLARALGVESITPASEEDLKRLGTERGSVPIKGLEGAHFIGDLSLKTVKNFVGGNKRAGEELEWKNVNLGRDFQVEKLLDIAEAKEGATCARCKKGKLEAKRAIEFGHCFKQDHFYTSPQKGYFVDKDGKEKPVWMGAYGIGIGRAMAAIVETHHDQRGIIWPKSVAPFLVHLIAIEESVCQKAEEVYQKLREAGVEVLYDDREDVSAGEKFADADLIGCPFRAVVSQDSLKKGGVEVKKRDEEETKILPLAKLPDFISKS